MLFDPFGPFKNRVVMSAMTRNFAPQHTATESMAAYYGRRAADGVGLILTEGTIVHVTGDGYNDVPHIQTREQAESWKKVTAAVHATPGAKIYCQLWHCGRISHADYTGGVPPVSSTDRPAEGINRQNNKPFGTPRRLSADELPSVYEQYVVASRHAMEAGFDGVELHFGHGYLADQFFDARINDRTDRYGGSIENRCRFALECLAPVLAELGPEKVMVRISPSRDMGGVYDWPDLEGMIDYLIPALDASGLRMLDVSCARADYYQTSGRVIRMVRPRWKHTLIGGASLSVAQAEEELRAGLLDMVTWGRFILANPDFVSRVRAGTALAPMEPSLLKVLV